MTRARTDKPGRDRHDYRVTVGGALFLVGLVMIAAAAVNTQRSLLFFIFGVMTGAVVLSVVVSRRMLASVEVRRDMSQRAFANRVVHLGYLLRHRRKRGPAVGLELAEVDPPKHLQSVGAYCLCLAPGASFRSGSRFVVRRRGRYTLSAVRLSTRLPLSLLTARREVRQRSSLVVWPALGRLRSDVLARGAAEISDGAPSQSRSGADEFFGLREYRQGDNPRWIHWRRTAVTGRPVVREMSKPRPDVLYVLLDTQLPDASAESARRRERLIRFAATLLEHACHREYRVGVALACSDRVVVLPPAAGRGQRGQVLDALAEIDDNTARAFSEVLAHLPRRSLLSAQVVAVGPDRRRLEGLAELRAACRRLSVFTPEDLDGLFDDDPHCQAGPDEVH